MQTPRLDALPPSEGVWLEVDIGRQCLVHWQGEQRQGEWSVSTGLAGTGQREGSGCTPLGWHYVRAAIGDGLPPVACFAVGVIPVRRSANRWPRPIRNAIGY